MATLWNDVRFALRMLAKNPGFAAVGILTLALGIGANTAIFSLVDGIVLRALPYPNAHEIAHVSWAGQGEPIPDLSVPQLKFLRAHSTVFSAMAGWQGRGDLELSRGGTAHWIKSVAITDGFFETLGVNLQLGRPFGAEYTLPNGANATVLTDSLWRGAFKGDPRIIGQQISLDGVSYTVTGVLPPGFTFAVPADVFVPLHFDNNLGNQGLNTDVIARLKSSISLSQGNAEVRLIGAQFQAQATSTERQEGRGSFHLDRYQDWLASNFSKKLWTLLGAVGLLLLIACANVASLLLARATSRQREVAVRLALGASRGRLLQQFLAEGLLLGFAGAAAGLVAAVATLRIFVAAIPWDLPALVRIGLDARVLAFTVAVGIGASVAFGLASFWKTRQLDLQSMLKDGRGISGTGRSREGVLNALVVGEVAISLMLAVGAGLLLSSLYHLYQQTLGFDPAHLMVMETPLVPSVAASSASILNFERNALERIEAIPGVESAATVSTAPLNGGGNLPAQREGHPEDSIGGMEYRAVSEGYFKTMRIAVTRGRAFEASDFAGAAPVILVSKRVAREWWPGGNPIGDHVVVGEFRGHKYFNRPPAEVIGVVADVKGRLLGQPAPPTVYVPVSAASLVTRSTDWVVRTSATSGIAAPLRKAILDAAPDERIVQLEPMTQVIRASVAEPNFLALLMGTFGALALVLMLVGVYGVANFRVAQRTNEIGIRMALGATRSRVLRMVLVQGVALAAMGIAMGAVAAAFLARLMGSILFEVTPLDPVVFAGAAAMLLVAAALACLAPALRATRVDPMVALRYE